MVSFHASVKEEVSPFPTHVFKVRINQGKINVSQPLQINMS